MDKKGKLIKLLTYAQLLGLREDDFKNASNFLNEREFELCFDIVVTQIYEYDIPIDKDFYNAVVDIGQALGISSEDYSCLLELIKDSNK